MSLKLTKQVLWWGRFDAGYSRNSILRKVLRQQDWQVLNYRPMFSQVTDLQTFFNKIPTADLIWVPCFRQRDLLAASRWSRRRNIPVVFDPLISAYDKQVFERKKFTADSRQAKRLLKWEKSVFQAADLVLADTNEHARFFVETLGVAQERVAIVPVGADEGLFRPVANEKLSPAPPLKVLFYGSFLHLQGPEVIARAARQYRGAPVQWTMLGEGPLLDCCKMLSEGLDNLEFLPWVDYQELPGLIQQADVLLGVFGTTEKAGRVIPNKVYQSLACGKPLVTRYSPAYPENLLNRDDNGIRWVPQGDPQALAESIAKLAANPEQLEELGLQARRTYEKYFSMEVISKALRNALQPLLSQKARI